MFFFLLESRPDLTNEYQTASTVNPNPPPTLSPHLPVQAPPICSTPPARLGRAAYPPPSGFPTGLVTGWSLVFLAFEWCYIVISNSLGDFCFSSRHALMVVMATWITGIGISIPPLFGWSE